MGNSYNNKLESKKQSNKLLKKAGVDTQLLHLCNTGNSPNSKQKRLSVVFSGTRDVRSNTIGGSETNFVEPLELSPREESADTPRKRGIVLLHVEAGWKGKLDPRIFRGAVKKQLSAAECKDLLIMYPEERCEVGTFDEVSSKENWEFKSFSLADKGEEVANEEECPQKGEAIDQEKCITEEKVVRLYKELVMKFHIRKIVIVVKDDLNYTLNAEILNKAEQQGTLLSLYVAGNSKEQRLKRTYSLRAAKRLGIPIVEGSSL